MNYRDSLSAAEREKLRQSRVCVVGCGGLGGYIAEYLIRLGVEKMTVIDGDCFDRSNLNRQLYSTEALIGHSKAEAVRERAALVNPAVEVIAVKEFLDESNADGLVAGHDLVIDALDSIEARKILHVACKKHGINMVYGAISPWHLQYGVLPPDSGFFDGIPAAVEVHGDAVLSFVPAICAAYEVAEAVKLLSGNESELMGRICDIDLLTNEQFIFEV